MSPRPRTASDAAILEAAARLLPRHGPARMRLEDVARKVGLAPATLLLRFKTKRNLLLAVAEHVIAGMAESLRTWRLQSHSALHVVTDVSDCVREIAEEPAAAGQPAGVPAAEPRRPGVPRLCRAPRCHAGAGTGDAVIVAFNDKPVDQFNDLPRMVAAAAPGEKVTLTVLRKGKEKTIKVKLGDLPEEEAAVAAGESGQELGLQLQEITPELGRTHELASDKGLIVTDLDPAGVAAEAGIRRGDIILEINQSPAYTISEFQKKVRQAKPGEMMLFLIKRMEGSLYIAVEKK